MPQSQITANVSAEEEESAKIAAIRAKKSLRDWAGEAVREKLERLRADINDKLSMRTRGPKTK